MWAAIGCAVPPASIISSEATLLSALSREESRGAHQREDFKDLRKDQALNIRIELEEDSKIKLSKDKANALEYKIFDTVKPINATFLGGICNDKNIWTISII